MSEARPAHFPPGTLIGRRYTVEGLVRLAEGRMFYLVHDDRPDSPRICTACGYADNPPSARSCAECGAAVGARRYLMSSRWRPSNLDGYEALHALGLDHPGLCSATDVVRMPDQLLSFVPYTGEGLMVDEAAPLSNQRLLHIAQRVLGTLAHLVVNGVLIRPIRRSNLLISPDGTVRLYDLEVERISDGAVDPAAYREVVRRFADLLGQYCHVRSTAMGDFLHLAQSGDYPTPLEFGRAIETRFDAYAALAFPATLGAMSDVGLARQLNEDNWGWASLGRGSELFVVADGMGGHDGGEVASELAVDTICRVARERLGDAAELDGVEQVLDRAFQEANNTIKGEAERKGNDMGTTLVAALLHEGRRAFVANVGDSRAYLYRDRTLHQVTVDHSFVQKLVERGRISKEEARHHPQSNILLRTVGTERDVEIDLFRVELMPGDRLILCSDGLWGEVEDADIATILGTYRDPRVAARELVRASHQGGGKDNVTLMVVQVA